MTNQETGPHYAVGARPNDPNRNSDGDGVLIAAPTADYATGLLMGRLLGDQDLNLSAEEAQSHARVVSLGVSRMMERKPWNRPAAPAGTVYGYGIAYHDRSVSECLDCKESRYFHLV